MSTTVRLGWIVAMLGMLGAAAPTRAQQCVVGFRGLNKLESSRPCREAGVRRIHLPDEVIANADVTPEIRQLLRSATFCYESGQRIYIRQIASVNYATTAPDGGPAHGSDVIPVPVAVSRSADALTVILPDGNTRSYAPGAELESPACGFGIDSPTADSTSPPGDEPDWIVP